MKQRVVQPWLLALSVSVFCSFSLQAQIHARYNFTDYVQRPKGMKEFRQIPLAAITINGTNMVVGEPYIRSVNAAGSITVSNMLPGIYRIQFVGDYDTYTFTNWFGTNVSGLVNGSDYTAIDTNLPNSLFAYSQTAADNLFTHKAGDTMTGGLTNRNRFEGNGVGLTNIPGSAIDAATALSIASINAGSITSGAINAGSIVASTAFIGNLIGQASLVAAGVSNQWRVDATNAVNTLISNLPPAGHFLNSAGFTDGSRDAGGVAGVTNVNADLFGGFLLGAFIRPTSVLHTNSTLADIQAAVNRGGIIYADGPECVYTITNKIAVTNGFRLFGNGSTWKLAFTTGLTNMFDTGTNLVGSPIEIGWCNFDGQQCSNFSSSTYFVLVNGSADPVFSPWWSNRTCMRISAGDGGSIHDNIFQGWVGNAVELVNAWDQNAPGHPNMTIHDNMMRSNYCAVLLPGNSFQVIGYANGAAGPLFVANPEYAKVYNNVIFKNTFGCVGSAGNLQFQHNSCTDNKWDLYVGFGAPNNSGHGNYGGNTFNHSSYPIWMESTQGGLIHDNSMLACDQIVMIGTTYFQFCDNIMDGPINLTMTNTCKGIIAGNAHAGVWGTNPTTNFTSSTLIITNNVQMPP